MDFDFTRHFVDVGKATAGALAASPDDRTPRVLVGKKGVGKTVYLRRMQTSVHNEGSMYAGEREAEPPSTEEIMRIGQLLTHQNLVEAWQLVWRRAIQRSVLSHLLYSGGELRGTLDGQVVNGLEDEYRELGRLSRTPRPIYAEVTDIIRSQHSGRSLTEYLKRREWDDFQYWFETALKQVRPIYLYIDLVDDNFANAPMYWVPCQMGLFLEVWRLIATEAGRRLHVVICLRDIVWSRLMRTEHASRYRTSPHVRVLEWDYPELDYLLHEKIHRLGEQFVLAPGEDGVTQWLGRTTIRNCAREVDESCEDYMLRHTRLIPRDIIELGNELSKQIAQLRSHDQSEFRTSRCGGSSGESHNGGRRAVAERVARLRLRGGGCESLPFLRSKRRGFVSLAARQKVVRPASRSPARDTACARRHDADPRLPKGQLGRWLRSGVDSARPPNPLARLDDEPVRRCLLRLEWRSDQPRRTGTTCRRLGTAPGLADLAGRPRRRGDPVPDRGQPAHA
ncbi:MAG TPA: hypothetical protein VMU39_03275 [Solirubrobacteraceae bacterium]|nr:hypothetical protein [Solirubrobacteraceae bacterium]